LVRALLWLGVEDYTGLWEAAAEAGKFALSPSRWDACRTASAALTDMVANRWITLYRCEEPLDSDRVAVIPADQVESALSLGPLWDAPGAEAGFSVRYLTTDDGRSAYDAATRAHFSTQNPSQVP
jgi:hypothetical protein